MTHGSGTTTRVPLTGDTTSTRTPQHTGANDMPANVETIATAADEFIGHYSGNRKPWWVTDNKDGRWVEAETIRTPEDMLRLSRTDWTVSKRPMWTVDKRGDDLLVPDHFVIVRDDTDAPLGPVGSQYTCLQNDALATAAFAIAQEGAKFVSGMSLGEGHKAGRIVCYVLKPDESEFRMNGQRWEHFILATQAHDGTAAIQIMPTPVCVECTNTYTLALRGAQERFTMRHTSGATAESLHRQAVDALGISSHYRDEFENIAAQLADIDLNERKFGKFLDQLVPLDTDKSKASQTMAQKRRDGIDAAYRSKAHKAVFGTGWGAVQGVNDYELWDKNVRGDRSQYQALSAVTRREPLTAKAVNLLLA